MNAKSKVAFWCYLIAIAPPAAWGIMFALREEFMPYHATAVGMPWSEVPGPLQVLILGFMKLTGIAWLTSAAAVIILLLVPFRSGVGWARWAVPCLAILHYAGVINAMLYVTQRTPAAPPWAPTLAGLALVIVGTLLSLPGLVASRRA